MFTEVGRFALFLLATLATGLAFRWQMAGLPIGELASLDLRRAHTHLGYYGALFPAAWLMLRSVARWVPTGRWSAVYAGLVVLSAAGFLTQGYGPLSIAASTGILAVWLVFAWRNRPGASFFAKDWMASSALSILLSALIIPLVAVKTRSDPGLANALARFFLTLLLFGVFVPAALRLIGTRAPRAWAWSAATILTAAHLTLFNEAWPLAVGLLYLAYAITQALLARSGQAAAPGIPGRRRLLAFWLAFALALALTGLRAMPHTHPLAVAGIHFLILGPIMMTFALAKLHLALHPAPRLLYEAAVVTMTTAIALPQWAGAHAATLQKVAGAAGGLILAVSVFIVVPRAWPPIARTRMAPGRSLKPAAAPDADNGPPRGPLCHSPNDPS